MKTARLLSNHRLEWIKAKIYNFSFITLTQHLRSSRIPSNDSIRDLSGRLSRLAVDLNSACQSVEPHFIRLGKDLQAVYSDAEDLVRRMSTSITLIGGDTEESLLTKIGTTANESLKDLKDCQSSVSENLSHIEIVGEQLGNLYAKGKIFEKIAMFLRVIGLNMGIESFRSTESRVMFGVVAHDIKTLSEKVIEIVKTFLDECESARTGQLNAHKEISAALLSLRKLAAEAEKGTQDAVAQIKSLMELTLKTLERAGGHSQEISRQVGEVVVGIQFHDDMSQRIEHIIKSLADIEKICERETSSTAAVQKNTDAGSLSAALSILVLQTAQLNHVLSEVDEIYQKTKKAFEEIMHEVGSLTKTLSILGTNISQDDNTAEGLNGNPFTDLKSAFEYLQKIHTHGADLFAMISQTVNEASEATRILFNHAKQVRGISFTTHLMALNAIVQAAHLGDKGSTLEILAQEVKTLSNQSSNFVDAVEKIFESLTASALQLTGATLQDGVDSVSVEKSEISLEKSIQEISANYETFINQSREAMESAGLLKDLISQTDDGLHFLPNLAGQLNAILGQLEEVSEVLNSWSDQGGQAAASEAEKLALRYTMHKERKIHDQLLGPIQDINPEAQNDFAADTRPVKSKITKYNSDLNTTGLDENLCRQNAEKGRAEPLLNQQTDTKDGFGDNVELF